MILPVPTVAKRNREIQGETSLSPSLRGHCYLCILSREGQRDAANNVLGVVQGSPNSAARRLVPLQHEPRAPQAMKPALWLRLHPCAGTGITRTDVTAKTARPRSSRVVPSFLTNSFQITHASTSVSLLAAYLPLKPRTPSTHSISLATRTHLKARQR